MSEKNILEIVLSAITDEISKRLDDKFENHETELKDIADSVENKLQEFEDEHIEKLEDRVDDLERVTGELEYLKNNIDETVGEQLNGFADRLAKQILAAKKGD